MDMVFEFEGFKVYVDLVSFCYFVGIMIDYLFGMLGIGFKFDNFMVMGICGCGIFFVF